MKELKTKDLSISFNKNLFFNNSNKSITDNYIFIKQILKGENEKIFKVKNIKNRMIYSCKEISKLNLTKKEKLIKEINILSKLDHPNIINLHEIYESDNNLFLIAEYFKGIDLISFIYMKNQNISEEEIIGIFIQIISIIKYCHKNNICLINLDPENFVFTDEYSKENNNIKIINFKSSQIFELNEKLKVKIRPTYFIAPEVLSGTFDYSCDIWGAGVLLYFLLSGEPPFSKKGDKNIYENIRNIKYSFPSIRWNNISDEAKDLIKQMLLPEGKRISIEDILSHPWINKLKKLSLKDFSFNISIFKKYKYFILFKRIVLTYIASRVNDLKINSIRKLFKVFDVDNDGQITLDNFKKCIIDSKNDDDDKDNEQFEKEINLIFSIMDTDKNNKIEFTEFLSSILPEQLYLNKYVLFEAFSFFSQNNYKISMNELIDILKINFHKIKEIENIFQLVDKNHDGIIEFIDFTEMMGLKNT